MADVTAEVRTFLFTDIVGSTRLWEEHPEAMRDALALHNDLLRLAIEAEGGVVFKTMGDAFYAAFSDAVGGLRAAVAAQRALGDASWPAPAALTVRMGLHTGPAESRDGDYFGPVLNRVARLESIAHGGQILVSRATADALGAGPPEDVTLLDLGDHRLKDLDRSEHLFQLLAPGLVRDFPALRSLENPELPNNLPEQVSTFIGRQHELADIRDLVRDNRLVTLVGTGGAGKTRLALAVAADMLDGSGGGVWFVELGSIADPDLVISALAQVLGLREEPRRALFDTVTTALADRAVLLVLDNCEHVIGAAANVADQLLRACPRVHLLATSRQPMSIEGEYLYRVPSMTLPATTDQADDSDAVQFFAERARRQQASFRLDAASRPLVADICRRLDGIPLAIELAAVRLGSLSLAEVHRRLDDRFALLTGGDRSGLARQQTLRATVDWSYDLLSEHEAMVLCHLSVFAGGFTIEAAEAIFGAAAFERFDVIDTLVSLADKSLLHPDANDANRFRLHETIRQYAGEKLVERGAHARHAARDAHAAMFLELAEHMAPRLSGREQKGLLEQLEVDRDNLRLAMGYFLSVPARHEQALRLGIALRRLWLARGHWAEGRELLMEALELPGAHAPRLLRARALCVCGQMCARRSEHLDAQGYYEEALEIARAINDEAVVADALAGAAWALLCLGHQHDAAPLADEAVEHARTTGDRQLLGLVLERRASINYDDRTASMADYNEALGHLRAVEDLYSIGIVENNLGDLELLLGDHRSAQAHIEVAIAISHELEDTSVVYCYLNLGTARLLGGDLEGARRAFLDAYRGALRIGDQFVVANAVLGLALCLSADGGDSGAAELHGVADALLERLHSVLEIGELRRRAEDQSRLKERLGTDAFEASYRTGRALPQHEGISRAVASAGEITTPEGSAGAR
jgi:predicted ATPase/class 3 adenylate cyclase